LQAAAHAGLLYPCESLESRLLLSAANIGAIAPSINPALASVIHLASGAAARTLTANSPSPQQQYFKLAADSGAFDGTVQFGITSGSPGGGPDAGLALYDEAGNFLASADLDAGAKPWEESLSATLQTGRAYILGVLFAASPTPAPFVLTTSASVQPINQTIKINPATGAAQFNANDGEDTFNTAADVDYYLLDLTNAAPTGSVTVTPTGLDGKVAATLFRRASESDPWTPIASASDAAGQPITLSLASLPAQSLTDADFMLAASPFGYASAPGSYQIGITTQAPTVAPVTVNPNNAEPAAPGFPALPPAGTGTGKAIYTSSLPDGGQKLYKFSLQQSGQVEFAIDAGNAFQPVLSLYDQTGQDLLAVRSRTSEQPLSFKKQLDPGNYIVGVSDYANDDSGSFTLSIQAPYPTENLPLTAPVSGKSVTTVSNIPIGSSTPAKYYRIQLAPGMNVLSLGFTAGPAGGAKFGIVSDTLPYIEHTAAAGQTVTFTYTVTNTSLPLDIYVIGTGGNSTGTLRIGQLDVPDTIDADDLVAKKIDLTGNVTPSSQNAGAFGNLTGIKFYQLLTLPGAMTSLAVQGAGGSVPLFAQYEESGGTLRLKRYELPGATNGVSSVAELKSNHLHGLVAFSLGFGGAGSASFEVNGPNPEAVGVGMVPDPPPDLPYNPTSDLGPWHAVLKIRDVTFENDFEQHLWKTLLPANIKTVPVVTFDPNGNNLRAKVTVYNDQGTEIGSATNLAGQTLTIPLPGQTAAGLKAKEMKFRVEPLAGQPLGDGIYDLLMNVDTDNPHPFETIEDGWTYPGHAQVGNFTVIPGSITNMVQNQFGDGQIEGNITSNTLPLNSAGMDVFRFWAHDGPVRVWTTHSQIIGAQANTNIRLYKAHFDANDNIDYIGAVPNTSPSFDWFPADRSEIDAQVYVNQFHQPTTTSQTLEYTDFTQKQYDTGGGMYFVVVKGQEGTTGRYTLHVDAPDMPVLGGYKPGSGIGDGITYAEAKNRPVVYLSSTADSTQTLKVNYVGDFTELVGYYAIQIPEHHDGTLTVTSNFNTTWDMALFDPDGAQVAGLVQTLSSINGPYVQGTFTIPGGPMAAILRLKERSANLGLVSNLTLATSVNLRPGTIVPPATFPVGETVRPMDVNQFGDGAFTDTLTQAAPVRSYAFKAPPKSPLTIKVTPTSDTTARFRWAVYVDGTLKAWDSTSATAETDDTGTTTLWLPDNNLHDVVVRVQLISAHASVQFTMKTDSASAEPLAGLGGVSNGTEWRKLYLQDGASNIQLKITPQGILGGPTPLRYWIYSVDGELLTSGSASAGPPQSSTATVNLPPEIVGGNTYYVRAGWANSASLDVSVTFSATFTKGNFILYAQPPIDGLLQDEIATLDKVNVRPDGTTSLVTYPTTTNQVLSNSGFWVEKAGKFHVDVTLTNATNPWIALYRVEFRPHGEFDQNDDYEMDLVDYVNNAGHRGNGAYSLDSYLEQGMYIVKVRRTNTTSGQAKLDFHVPEYPIQEIIIDPNSGKSFLPNLWSVDYSDAAQRGGVGNNVFGYRTKVFKAVTPAGSLGPVRGRLQAFNNGRLLEDRIAQMKFFESPSPGFYTGMGFTGDNTLDPPAVNPQFEVANMASNVKANPFQEYYLMLDRDLLGNTTAVSIDFDVPQSGTPDLQVDPLALLPNEGETRVDIRVRNGGYAPSGGTFARFEYTDTSKNPDHITSSDRFEDPIGPFAFRDYSLPWLPVTPDDTVRYMTDYVAGDPDGNIEELDETNNKAQDILSRVDKHAPTITLSLEDPSLDGNSSANVWGRYISGVYGVNTNVVINVTDADDANDTDGDGKTDRFRVLGYYPSYNPIPQVDYSQGLLSVFGNETQFKLQGFDFGYLRATHAGNPNEFEFWGRDKYGLYGPIVIKTAQVMPRPGWLKDGGGQDHEITFNDNTKRYEFKYRNALVDLHGSLDSILDTSLPFIGGLNNAFLVEVLGEGSASLNPTELVSASTSAHAQITIMGEDILNETYSGNQEIADHISVNSSLVVNKLTLDADFFKVTFRITDYPLFNFQSPKIPLFSYGVPGVAAISANLSFSVSADVDAAISLAIKVNDNLLPTEVGLSSPTFVAPTVTAGLNISGDIEFLGFDLASLTGTINFGITPAYGLTSPLDQFVPFEDFFDYDAIDITAELYGSISAEVLGFEVFSFDLPSVDIDFTDGPPVVKGAPVPGGAPGKYDGIKVLPAGDSAVGNLRSSSRPQLVIDPTTGKAVYVQVVDTDAGPGVRNNLGFSTRAAGGGAWTPIQVLADGSVHVSNPALALTHDGANVPAVVVYQAMTALSDPANRTRNELLNSQDIRYRYHDGATWGPEISLTADSLYDFDHAVAFNNAGQGAVAWIHNKNIAPILPAGDANAGQFWRHDNELHVAKWNAIDHKFELPTPLTADSIADSRPAVFAAADGTLYVVWIKDAGNSNQVMFSKYTGGSWSAPALLPTTGLPAGGKLNGIAIGSDGGNRVHVLLSHSVTDPTTQQVTSRLYSRATTALNFSQPTAVEIVAQDANFSSIKTTNTPDGALMVYWQQGDGVINDIYASKRGPFPSGPSTWSAPMKLTAGAEHEMFPSVAPDTDGKFLVAFEAHNPPPSLPGYPTPFGHPDPVPAIQGLTFSNGVGTTAIRQLAELGFTRRFAFERNGKAAIGSRVAGHAQIVNRGLVEDKVLIEFLENNTVIGSQTILLKPGQTFDISRNYVVKAGSNNYSVKLTPYGGDATPGGEEVFGPGDNTSAATLTGVGDVSIERVTLSNPQPAAGEMIFVTARVRNLAAAPTGPFKVFIYDKDPQETFPNKPLPVGQYDINSIPANSFFDLVFPWTVPAAGGKHVLTLLADALNVIPEVTELNNEGYSFVIVQPEASPINVTSEVLNYSGIDNVRVRATIVNNGKAAVNNLPVQLFGALDEGPYSDQGTKTIALLAPGASVQLEWLADGLAGLNRYRVAIDPAQTKVDTDKSNNTAETSVIIQGLPDLVMGQIQLSAFPQQKEPLNVLVTVKNVGIAKAPATQVEVFALGGSLGGQILVGKIDLAEMPALSQRNLVIPIDTTQLVGFIELIAVVDRKRKILEVSDLNNQDSLRIEFAQASRITGRHVFYNNSSLDKTSDDNAIDPAKSALRPGQQASIDNYTVFSKGINGIMIDFEEFTGTPTLASFVFHHGNDANPDKWDRAPNPISMTVRQGENRGDPDRVTIIWADGSVRNTWVRVTVLPGAATGLTTPDVFYFGNLSGDFNGDGSVDHADFNDFRKNFGLLVPAVHEGDFDGDAKVNFADFQALEAAFGKKLNLFRAPVPAPIPSQPSVAAAVQAKRPAPPVPAKRPAAPSTAATPVPVASKTVFSTRPLRRLLE
jgi:hypothetical protein